MITTNDIIKSTLQEYSNKNTKICREIKKGKLIKIKNALYETDENVNGYLLAGSIYGPSYLSFDFALAYYSLIPEKVNVFTSATFLKKKKKEYTNTFGTYIYRDVPKNVYAFGINVVQEGEYYYQIATIEKAICDKLYTLKPVKNLQELKDLLFKDLRIDYNELIKINLKDLEELANLYHCTNVKLLYKFMRRQNNE